MDKKKKKRVKRTDDGTATTGSGKTKRISSYDYRAWDKFDVVSTVKFLNFRMPENFALMYLKFKQRGQTIGYFIKKMQMEKQTVKTLIRLLL